MGFESVPDDIESFFNSGGEVPESLKSEITPPAAEETPPSGEPPASEHVNPPVAETPPAEAPATPPVTPQQQTPDYSAQIRQQQATLDALTKTLTDMQAAKKAAEDAANAPPVPDPEKDPLGYLTFQIKQVGDQVEALKQTQTQTTQETQQQTQFRQFVDTVNSKVAEFKATATDYDDAYKHLVTLRHGDYLNMGYTSDQAAQLVGQEETRLAANALREGKNPASVAYELAKSHGYVPKVKTAQIVPAESKLDSIKKGLETTGAERASPPPTYSTDSIKTMTPKQLTDAVENHWDELFGKSKSKGIFD